ncbi:hypothetical protein K504DRAFT_388185 [Pleomassaria siparia CBS 279.74]|uniref:Zn(2)-C6 fungal-type domain-containing protein n=1 Tax=Pleomassaria siparia CBS 279.74 TaxID=1314801 RepID=A0A6G1JXQ8_9PLEO|nr:hypothetical protein K504DRAFT_388185 [Pleomassaria siparia CBS 279.74]
MNRETKTRQRRRLRVVPDEARVRAARACANCRRLKEKCDGSWPCARCLRTAKNCKYTSTEPHSSSSKTVDEEAERVRYLEQLAIHFLGPTSLDVGNLRRIVDRIGSRQENDDNDAQAGLEHELNDLTLEEEDCAVKAISQGTFHYSGEFSHWVFSQQVRRRVNEHLNGSEDKNQSLAIQSNGRVLEYWRATHLQSTGSHVLNTLDCLPPRRVADAYFQKYFRFAQTNTFFVEPGWLQSKFDVLYQRPAHLSSADSSWVCTVLMVLAIGFQFAHMAEGPLTEPSSPLLKDDDPLQTRDASRIFYRMATMLIPDIITIASMESVQACLLLAHYALPLDTHGLAYTYLGLAMKLGIQNGMHRKYTGSGLDEWTVEMRNRLWWTAYTLERRISVLHGRPTSTIPSEMDADLPNDILTVREHEFSSSFRNISTMIDLTTRLSDISHAITKLRKCPKSLRPIYFKTILDRYKKLQIWWRTNLEANINPISTFSEFRAHTHLKLWFHIIEIFIGRPFMFHNTKQLQHQTQATSDQNISTSSVSGRVFLVERAVAAAHQVIKLLNTLSENIGLARASYIEFSACRAALLILLAQSLNERSEQLSATIALGMRLLRFMASGNILSARSETSVIEALEEAVRRLHMRENSRSGHASGSTQENTDQYQNGFVHYNEWVSLWSGLDAGIPQYFPGNGSPISPQPYNLLDYSTLQQPELAGWYAEDYNFIGDTRLEPTISTDFV